MPEQSFISIVEHGSTVLPFMKHEMVSFGGTHEDKESKAINPAAETNSFKKVSLLQETP